MTHLKGMTWNHTRGYLPVAAVAQRYEELTSDLSVSWSKRSLQSFADQPIDTLAEEYDLIVIDHPWVGVASRRNVLVPLDEYITAPVLEERRAGSVGPSYDSYVIEDKIWALPIDAATPVASYRPDVLSQHGVKVPTTWSELLDIAQRGLVLVPGIPQDTLMNFFMMCCTLGEDPFVKHTDSVVTRDVGVQALKLLKELSDLLPRESFDMNPIRVYEAMTDTDTYGYCPFAYGYVNYSTPGYAKVPLTFVEQVDLNGEGKMRTTLGGAGIAVSAKSSHVAAAVEFAEHLSSGDIQAGHYCRYGGQPAHRRAWLDTYNNGETLDYFRSTLPTLERAYLRPRYDGYMLFQDNSGAPIRDYLLNGGDEEKLLDDLDALYVRSLEGGA